MKNITRHKGKLTIISRLPNSKNGNPRYLISIDGWTCRTAVDSGYAYDIANHDGKQVEATIGMHYGQATLNSIGLVKQ